MNREGGEGMEQRTNRGPGIREGNIRDDGDKAGRGEASPAEINGIRVPTE